MAFIRLHTKYPIPYDGFMVCTNTVHIRAPQCVALSSCTYLLEPMEKMIPLNEVLVVCEWEHAFFIETWRHMNNKAAAKAYSRMHGFKTIYNCGVSSIEYVDLAWKKTEA